MTEPAKTESNLLPMVLAVGIFAVLSVAAAATSDGFLEADACTHYLYARFAFAQPHFFVNIWGRPICTALYSVPAILAGRFGVRMVSLAMAIGCGLVAFAIARQQNYRWPALALIFTLAQPLVFLHSFSELTELPFALLLGLGFLAFQTRRWFWFALVMGSLPASRPEGFGFLFLAAAGLVIYRRARWLAVLLLPLLVWNYCGWLEYGRQGAWYRWLIDNWPYSTQSAYEPGTIFHFLKLMPVVASPFVFPALCVGIWRSFKSANTGLVQMLVAIVPLLMLVGHSALYALGKMASSGEIRYMLIVAPFWGLLSAKGWEWIFAQMNWPGILRMAGVAALLPALANCFYRVVPIQLDADALAARDIAAWLAESDLAKSFPRVASASQTLHYFMGTIGVDSPHSLEWLRDKLEHPSPGAIIVWHRIYSVYNSDQRRQVPLNVLRDAGWIDITDSVPPRGTDWRFLISPVDAQGRDARETLRSLSIP